MPRLVRNKLQQFLATSRTNKLIALAAVLVVATSGLIFLTIRAAGFFASTESDTGNLTANAKVITDTSASGGRAIQFTAPAPSPTPTPTPTPTPATNLW
ncbi:MAG TPA: hypothetical protein VLE73_05600 [Candidatus Saccharimonadales bacterium]|nr:hypothetical protein [Candidatus Saccharimonadales bacterium]